MMGTTFFNNAVFDAHSDVKILPIPAKYKVYRGVKLEKAAMTNFEATPETKGKNTTRVYRGVAYQSLPTMGTNSNVKRQSMIYRGVMH